MQDKKDKILVLKCFADALIYKVKSCIRPLIRSTMRASVV